MKQAFSFSCALLFGCLQVASAQSPSLLFEVPADARTAGLGGRLTADLSADLHAAAFNPAFLQCDDVGRVAIDYVNYFGTTTIGAVNGVLSADGRKTIAVGARFSTFGQLTELDAAGLPTGGQYSAGDVVVQSSVAWAFDAGRDHRITAGASLWAGTRSLSRDVAVLAGLDLAARGVMASKQFAWGAALTGAGRTWGLGGGGQPTGGMPLNVQLGLAKSFANAPFTLHLEASQLQTWDLAPPGTYDDVIDPLSGEASPAMAFPFGDALMRHLTIGTELKLSDALAFQFGYDYRRRQELRAGDRPGTNGLALGIHFNVKKYHVRVARNTYHFAGASTHLSVSVDLAS